MGEIIDSFCSFQYTHTPSPNEDCDDDGNSCHSLESDLDIRYIVEEEEYFKGKHFAKSMTRSSSRFNSRQNKINREINLRLSSCGDGKKETIKKRRGFKCLKACEKRKMENRREERLRQLEARKENVRKCLFLNRDFDSYVDDHDFYVEDQHHHLIMNDLGIGVSKDQERLFEIMNGAEITPEDYDLLLLLDNTNVKKTMDSDEISAFSIINLGSARETNVLESQAYELGSCDICMETFSGLDDETELRRLPCKHLFCKECVDFWLKNNCRKCPNLDCFWNGDECH